MSSALAIAAVTYVMRDLLNDGLVNSNLTHNVNVTARPPLRDPPLSNGDSSQLNLFLYQVSPNPGWRNVALPARNTAGDRVSNPPLALDLHYLLTVYDTQDYQTEILLGYAMQLLHENPGLAREQLRTSFQANVPAELKALAGTGLADQIESLKITPHYLTTDEMSKLWTGLQAPYRPSVAYQVSVVLIEAARPARTALPVLTRGLADAGFSVQSGLEPALPTLLAALPPGRNPAVASDGKFKIFGHHLRGTNLSVTLVHARLDLTLTVSGTSGNNPPLLVRAADPNGDDATEREQIPPGADTCVVVDLTKASDIVTAGWYEVSTRVRLPGDSQDRMSNAMTLAVAPRFATRFDPTDADKPVVTGPVNGFYSVQLKCTPALQPGQPATLLLGQNELRLLQPLASAASTVTFRGPLPGPADYLARLRVDGVDSLFVLRPAAGPPTFDPAQFIQVM